MASDLDLLLVGKTGAGKSKTGNTILNKAVFRVSGSTQSVTDKTQSGVRNFDGKVIKVFDAAGIADIRCGKEGDFDKMKQAILCNQTGYHALLYVIKYGQRLTEEDVKGLNFLKDTLGESFVKDHSIIVMTNGDTFEADNGDESFKEWCSKEKGPFSLLLNECKNRIVLFDNNTKEETKRNTQLKNLLDQISILQAEGRRYTKDNFEKASEDKKKILEEIKEEMNLIMDKMNKVKREPVTQNSISELEDLKERCNKQIKTVREKDKRTGGLDALIDQVETNKDKIVDLICEIAKEQRDAEEERERQKKAVREKSPRSTVTREALSNLAEKSCNIASYAGMAVVAAVVIVPLLVFGAAMKRDEKDETRSKRFSR